MIAIGLRGVQDALNRKADHLQHQFVQLSEQLEELGVRLIESHEEHEKKALREEQLELREHQVQLAEEINLWRKRAREVLQQRSESSLRNYLEELLTLEEDLIKPAIEQSLFLMDATDEEREAFSKQESGPVANTPAARLIERARTEYDLRRADPVERHRAAVEFSNRPNISQDDAVLEEIERAVDDPDPIVRELILFTLIQMHRFRSMRIADLDIAHQSVQALAKINHPQVIPVLVEILRNPRTGYVEGPDGSEETLNSRSRMVALLRLVEWHTAEAQAEIRARTFDRDPHISKAAERALELFPGEWTGPLKKSRVATESAED